MNKGHGYIAIVAFVIIALASCGSTKVLMQPHDENGAIVFVSAIGVNQSGSVGGTSLSIIPNKYGFGVKMENVETHQQFVSEYFKSSIRHHNRVFYNIPPGTYRIVEVRFTIKADEYFDIETNRRSFENHTYYNNSQELSDYFGDIIIEPSQKYFLGTYYCYDQGDYTGARYVDNKDIKLEYVEDESTSRNGGVANEILEAIEESDWKGGEFIMLRPASNENVFDFSSVFDYESN